MTVAAATKGRKGFHIIGHDIDVEMLRVLTPGDKVMAELNGTHLYSTSGTPWVATDHPWIVVKNIPDVSITLSNPLATDELVLPYSDLVTTAKRQPAVFIRYDSPYVRPGEPLYVILQMISCGMTETALSNEVEPFDEIEMIDFLEGDDRLKVGLLEEWCQVIERFNSVGWNYKTVKRFAIRSNVDYGVVNAFQDHDWQVLLALPTDTLMKVARELHALPHLLRYASSLIQHDVTAVME